MTRRASRTLLTVLLTTVLVLAGCGDGGDTAADRPTSTRPPRATCATATPVNGPSGGSFVTAPAGRREASAEVSAEVKQICPGLELVLVSSRPLNQFSDNRPVTVGNGDEARMKCEVETCRGRHGALSA